jgi:hypothetical protein
MKSENLNGLNMLNRLSILGLSRVFGLNPVSHNHVMGYMGALMQLFNIISLFGLKQNFKYNKKA